MELDDLKTKWNALDKRLAETEIVNMRMVKEMVSHKTKSAYDRIVGQNIYNGYYIRCGEDGKPVIIETSRMRRHNGKIADRRDNKYTGSNHTQILLGMTPAGKVIFADSADRKWSGSRQRLKEADLEDMIDYMFPQKFTSDTHKYFPCRSGTGGYILVDAFL